MGPGRDALHDSAAARVKRFQSRELRLQIAGCEAARMRSLDIDFTAWIEVPAWEAAHCHWEQFPKDTPS